MEFPKRRYKSGGAGGPAGGGDEHLKYVFRNCKPSDAKLQKEKNCNTSTSFPYPMFQKNQLYEKDQRPLPPMLTHLWPLSYSLTPFIHRVNDKSPE